MDGFSLSCVRSNRVEADNYNEPTITMNNTQVSQVTATKSLGVIIDDKLDWHSHIEKLTKKIASGIGALKRIRHLIPASTLHLVYQALVKPHFDYCDNCLSVRNYLISVC